MKSRRPVNKRSRPYPRLAKILPAVAYPGQTQGATERQAAVLAYIRLYSDDHGMPPTIAEIAKHFGCNANNIQQHVERMRAKGLLKPAPYPGAARSLVPA